MVSSASSIHCAVSRSRAFGEARRPVADGDEFQPPVVLQRLDLRAERIEVGDDAARRAGGRTGAAGSDRAAAGQLDLQPEAFEFACSITNSLVCKTGRARYVEKRFQPGRQVFRVNRNQRLHRGNVAAGGRLRQQSRLENWFPM